MSLGQTRVSPGVVTGWEPSAQVSVGPKVTGQASGAESKCDPNRQALKMLKTRIDPRQPKRDTGLALC